MVVPNAEVENAEVPNGKPVEIPVEPEEGALEELSDVDIAIKTTLDPETEEITSFTA